MQRSHDWSFGLVAFLVLLIFTAPSHCHAQVNISRAKNIVRTLYPELIGQNLSVKIRDDAPFEQNGVSNSFSVELSERWIAGTPRKCDTPDVMSAYFQFSDDSQAPPTMISFGGSAAGTDRLERINQELAGHAEWSISELSAFLRKQRARFPPDTDPQEVQLYIESKIGTVLGTFSVDSLRPSGTKTSDGSRDLDWVLYVTVRSSQTEMKYFVAIEPLDGKVVSVQRMPL